MPNPRFGFRVLRLYPLLGLLHQPIYLLINRQPRWRSSSIISALSSCLHLWSQKGFQHQANLDFQPYILGSLVGVMNGAASMSGLQLAIRISKPNELRHCQSRSLIAFFVISWIQCVCLGIDKVISRPWCGLAYDCTFAKQHVLQWLCVLF